MKTKHFLYSIYGGILGLVIGAFFGFVFDSFYTKRSQLNTKQTLQAFIFGGIASVIGISIGLKVASEEQNKKQKDLEYQSSLVQANCNFCRLDFQYSTLHFASKKYCDSCVNNIKVDYISKCEQVDNVIDDIGKLKRGSAIIARLDKIKGIAESMQIYEDVDLEFISTKPSEILENINEYRKGLG